MKNDLLKFYSEHNISPVRQTISDYQKHCLRRKKLYRQLGIPILSLKGAKVLEVGAGGGYNTLPLFGWGVEHVDIVEPNKTGREDIENLFTTYNIEDSKYSIFDILIEEMDSDKKYDIIIAEGFIQHLDNANEILKILEKFAHKDSIIIVTCSNEIGLYIEKMKRLIGNYLVRDIDNYDDKVKSLMDIYGRQLENLQGMSRKVEDWVQDQLLSPAIQCKYLFTLKDAMETYLEEFDILGSSQSIFVDYSWYKDTEYNYKADYIRQYDIKKHLFLFANQHEESIIDVTINNQLEQQIIKISNIAREIEKFNRYECIDKLIEEIKILSKITEIRELEVFNNELIQIMEIIRSNNIPELSNYENFSLNFGKSQQYISFCKI